MAANKHDTSSAPLTPEEVTVTYNNRLGKTTMIGNIQQVMNHLFTIDS